MLNRLLLAALIVVPSAAFADDWPQFRGPGGLATSAEKSVPVEWSADKHVRWRAALPGPGNSSPIVSRGRVFVTYAEGKGKKRSLVCIDRKNGKILWTRTVSYEGAEPTHKENPYCGATPCADGERVVVWHSSAGLYCYDFDGKEIWKRDLGAFDHMWGYASSPVIHEGRVLLNCGPGKRTFLISLDKKTGKTVWQQEESGGESKKWVGSWSTPLLTKVGGKPQIVIGYPRHVKGYDPATGKVLWTVEGLGTLVYADIVMKDGVGVATAEDEAGDSLGFRLGGSKPLWARKRKMEVSTGLIVEGRLWTLDDGGFIRCMDIMSGEEIHRERSPKGGAWGSMISAAGRIYVTTRRGDTIVFQPDPKGVKVLAVNSLGEPSNATPAVSDGEIFLRTNAAVYCVGGK